MPSKTSDMPGHDQVFPDEHLKEASLIFLTAAKLNNHAVKVVAE